MQSLQWVVLLAALGSIALAKALFGWPSNFNEAGGFASFVAAILTPASLMLLVKTLEKQESLQKQSTRDGFLSLQVQALIALIEDDRAMLDSMTAKYRATQKKSTAFEPVQKRYRQRVAKLNVLLGTELELPDLVERER